MGHSVLLLELGAIILALAILARFASRMGLSPIPLYLLAGLVLGKGGLIPVITAEEFIEIGAEIGIILLLFSLGLEYAADELASNLRMSAPAGIVDLVLNFGPGFAVGLLLGWHPVAAVFLGGITYTSSSGVVAKLLRDLGWMGNRETPAVLSVLIIEDLMMAAYLPLLAVLVAGTGVLSGAISLFVGVVLVALVFLVALHFGHVLSRIVFSHSDEVLLLSILGFTLLVAGLAERVQISAAVGAFLVGIALSGPAADRAHVLLAPLRDLFAAVFFVFFGLRIDPGGIPDVIGVALVLAAITSLTKVATGWWSSRRIGVGLRGRARAGAALIARGEFSIVIAGLAVAAGVEERIGALAAAYVLILVVLGPILTRFADPIAARFQDRRRAVLPAVGADAGGRGVS